MRRLEAVLSERWEPRRQDEWSFAFPWVAGSIPLSCYAQVNPDMCGFIFRAVNPLPVEPAKRPLVGEFIQRANYAQPIGNWAIDLDSGDVRFKNGVYNGLQRLPKRKGYGPLRWKERDGPSPTGKEKEAQAPVIDILSGMPRPQR
jgi:hypothetical protein